MRQCNQCGAVLPEGEQSVCLVCGAKQAPHTAAAAAPAHVATGRDRRKSQEQKLRLLAITLVALVVLLVVGVGATYFLYGRFNAQDSYDALGKALLSSDLPTLHTLVEGDGIEVTDAGLTALCRAFTTQESVDTLLAQLKAQSATPAAGGASNTATGSTGASTAALAASGAAPAAPPATDVALAYPALSPTSSTVFLGYRQHKLLAQPVALRIASVAQNVLLSVDGANYTGTPDEQGVLYQNFFPGIYTVSVSGQTALGEAVTGVATDLALFSVVTPVVFDGALPIADITVSGCISDDAIISVNGVVAAQKPATHVVSLPQVTVGSTISMSYTTAYGAVTTASVQFTDRTVTALAFAGHVTTGGVPTQAELEAITGAFYASYLDALNNADPVRITTCTEALREKLKAEVAKEEAKRVVSVFKTTQVDAAHIEQGYLDEATPTLKLNVICTFMAANRKDKDEKTHTIYYCIELVYADGGWKANRLAETTKENFDAGTLVPIE